MYRRQQAQRRLSLSPCWKLCPRFTMLCSPQRRMAAPRKLQGTVTDASSSPRKFDGAKPDWQIRSGPLIRKSRFRVYWMNRGALSNVLTGAVACSYLHYCNPVRCCVDQLRKLGLAIFQSQKDGVAMSHHISCLPFTSIILSDRAKTIINR